MWSSSGLDCNTCYAPTADLWDLDEDTPPAKRVDVPTIAHDAPAAASLLAEHLLNEVPVHLEVPHSRSRAASALVGQGNISAAVALLWAEVSAALPQSTDLTWGSPVSGHHWLEAEPGGGAQPHTDGHSSRCRAICHLQLSGAKRWAFHTHHNTTSTSAFRHRVGAGFISERVYLTTQHPGDVLVFWNSLQPHSVRYIEPNSSSVAFSLAIGLPIVQSAWSRQAFQRQRCGEERACEVHPELRTCFGQ